MYFAAVLLGTLIVSNSPDLVVFDMGLYLPISAEVFDIVNIELRCDVMHWFYLAFYVNGHVCTYVICFRMYFTLE